MLVKNVEKKEDNTVVFQVESDAAEFESAVQSAYLKNKAQIYIPGFRKGKAPRQIVEGMYGKEVFYQDALDDLAPKAFEYGVENAELRLVGAPSIVDFKVTDDRTAEFSFSAGLYPEVTLGEYKGLSAVCEPAVVTEEDVDKEIEAVRNRNARMVSVERAAEMGDTANIDFDGYLDGVPFDGGKSEGYDLELGSNAFVPGFEEQIVGMTAGEEKEINITFPEDYTPELAGKDVVFKVKVNSLTVKELDALDDEFAKDVSEFDTFEEYKADLKQKLEAAKKEQAESKAKAEVLKKAADNMTVTIPEVMISDKVEDIIRNYAANYGMSDPKISYEQLKQMMGLSDEVINMSIRPGAEEQVKNELLLEAVIKAENIEVTDDETDEYLNTVAEGMAAGKEEILSYFGKDFVVAEQKKEKASKLITDSAVFTEAPAEAAEEAPVEEKKPKTRKKAASKKKTVEVPAEEAVPAESAEE